MFNLAKLFFGIGSYMLPGLAKIIEESSELNTVLAKIIATGGDPKYWDGKNLNDEIWNEVQDLKAAIAYFESKNAERFKDKPKREWSIKYGGYNVSGSNLISDRTAEKLIKYEEWHEGERKLIKDDVEGIAISDVIYDVINTEKGFNNV